MKKVVDTMKLWELNKQVEYDQSPVVIKYLTLCHVSSSCFDRSKKSDLDIRILQSGRNKLPVAFTVIYFLMTLTTFGSHIWSNIVNYEDMHNMAMGLSLTIVITTR